MKFPKKIKVLCNDYQVETYTKPESVDNESVIRIDPNWNEQTQARTFLHEIIHAVFFMMGIKKDTDTEEKIVEPLASGLATVMRDNPKLFQGIQKALK